MGWFAVGVGALGMVLGVYNDSAQSTQTGCLIAWMGILTNWIVDHIKAAR